jgi:hypothetical protein
MKQKQRRLNRRTKQLAKVDRAQDWPDAGDEYMGRAKDPQADEVTSGRRRRGSARSPSENKLDLRTSGFELTRNQPGRTVDRYDVGG